MLWRRALATLLPHSSLDPLCSLPPRCHARSSLEDAPRSSMEHMGQKSKAPSAGASARNSGDDLDELFGVSVCCVRRRGLVC